MGCPRHPVKIRDNTMHECYMNEIMFKLNLCIGPTNMVNHRQNVITCYCFKVTNSQCIHIVVTFYGISCRIYWTGVIFDNFYCSVICLFKPIRFIVSLSIKYFTKNSLYLYYKKYANSLTNTKSTDKYIFSLP